MPLFQCSEQESMLLMRIQEGRTMHLLKHRCRLHCSAWSQSICGCQMTDVTTSQRGGRTEWKMHWSTNMLKQIAITII